VNIRENERADAAGKLALSLLIMKLPGHGTKFCLYGTAVREINFNLFTPLLAPLHTVEIFLAMIPCSLTNFELVILA